MHVYTMESLQKLMNSVFFPSDVIYLFLWSSYCAQWPVMLKYCLIKMLLNISLIHVVVQHCFADNASFNEKPHVEPKKSFSAKYVGCIDVPKPTGLTYFVCLLLLLLQLLFFICLADDLFGQYFHAQLRQKWDMKDEMFNMLQRNNMSSKKVMIGTYDLPDTSQILIIRFICNTVMP